EAEASQPAHKRSVVWHAKLIGIITFLSRIVGLGREMIAFRYFGDTGVWAAWKVAFTVPNLFRKLLGEGAISGAFVPLYSQKLHGEVTASEFAIAAVNLLIGLLLTLTILGEAILVTLLFTVDFLPNNLLVVKFSIIMLPYVTLVCLT